MNTVIIVVVIGVTIAMVVLMIRYAGFIHRFPHEQEPVDLEKENNEKPPPEDPSA